MSNILIMYLILALLFVILIIILMTPKQIHVEYVKEVPYPNYFAIWPSVYYRTWTAAGGRAGYGYSSSH